MDFYFSSYLGRVSFQGQIPIFDLGLLEGYIWGGPGIQVFPQPGLNATFQGWYMCLPYKCQHSYTIFHFPDTFDSVHFGLYE